MGSPVYLVSILTPPNVVDLGALLWPIRPLIGGWEELGGGTEGPAWGWVKDSASSSSSSAWLSVSLQLEI